MTRYQERIFEAVQPRLSGLDCQRALDFGCGDGWFARRFLDSATIREIVPLEVKRRPNCLVEPILYDGTKIPFGDQEFDLTYAMDVLHHCTDPSAGLREMMRTTRRFLMLKDHRYVTRAGWLALSALDEIGNRRFEIPSLYNYQHRWSWLDMIEANGFRRVFLQWPAPVHTGVLGRLTNHLQFIGLWERTG